jgi:hypothetical protein
MSAAARLQLKRPNGWFAAGQEVQRAATSLSDAAFKVFIWLCLHAERASGRLLITATALPQALRKSEAEITRCLEELVCAGACRWFEDGGIEIQDRFWPYERTHSRLDSSDAEAYVAAIKRIFLSHACVRSSFTPADEELARAWHRRGVTPEGAESAILLGVVRKYVALINSAATTPITTLHYFKELIEEASQPEVSAVYWHYLRHKLPSLELRWRNLRAQQRTIAAQETK